MARKGQFKTGNTIGIETRFKKGHPPTLQRFGKNNPSWKGGKEHRRGTARAYRRKREREDPSFRINRRISKAIWASLKGAKEFRKWEALVGYTLQDLMVHLERQFKDEMTWDNYGSYWEVDHIKPISLFNDSEFKLCWELKNLQPLEKTENRKKGNKF